MNIVDSGVTFSIVHKRLKVKMSGKKNGLNQQCNLKWIGNKRVPNIPGEHTERKEALFTFDLNKNVNVVTFHFGILENMMHSYSQRKIKCLISGGWWKMVSISK